MTNLLPLYEIEQPFHQEFVLFLFTQTQDLVESASEKGFLSVCNDSLKYIEQNYIIWWVVKLHFNSKFKLPAPRKLANFYKPLGLLYSDILKACERLHSYTGDQYRNAADWFCFIVREQRLGGLNLGTKANILQGIRKENQLLSKYQNPFEAEFPHTKRLFDLLLSTSEQNDILRKDVLEPIKKSRKAYATDYHRNGEAQPSVAINGKEYLQMPGSGSGRLELTPIYMRSENELISRNLI